MRERDNTTSPTSVVPTPTPDLMAKLLRVAWAAILLGLAMEAVLILVGTGFGTALGLGKLAADLVKNVSWSLFVCGGLAVGTTIAKTRLPLAGLAGLLAAPVAFEVSRVLHKGTLEMLAASSSAAEGASPYLIALVKGLEYGVLGIAISWLAQRPGAGAVPGGGRDGLRPDGTPDRNGVRRYDPRPHARRCFAGVYRGSNLPGGQRNTLPRWLLSGPLLRPHPGQENGPMIPTIHSQNVRDRV